MKSFFVLLFSILILVLPSCGNVPSNPPVRVYILNIGKADCIVVQSRDHTLMIDTGESENVPEILAFLQQKKITTIDTLILSHFDKDHIGGASEIIKAFKIKTVYQSTFSSDRTEFDAYHEALKTLGKEPIIVRENLTILLDKFELQLYPPKKQQYERKEDNNASLIVSLATKNYRLLFCGDAMEERLEEFISENLGSYDLVKLPYHGRFIQNYESFLSSVKCKTAFITCSEKNPSDKETLSLLECFQVKYYETSHGTIQVELADQIKIYQ